MKTVGAVVILFAAILSLGLLADHELKASTARLQQETALAGQALAANRWDAVDLQSRQLETAWDRETAWWPLVLDHADIDRVRLDIGRFKEYAAAKNTALAGGQLEELRLDLANIPTKEAVTLKNIL